MDKRMGAVWRRHLTGAAVVLVLLTGAGCASGSGWRETGIPPAAQVVSYRDLGPLRFDPAIRCRDGGYSGLWQGRSVWMFGDSVLSCAVPEGFQWRSSTAAATADFAAAAENKMNFTELADASGVPEEFLAFTPEEAAYNRRHFMPGVPEKERRRWALWPGAMVDNRDGSAAYVFYTLLACGPNGMWDFRSVGMSAALWRAGERRPTRDGMLFPAGDIEMGNAAVRDGDMVYAYGCGAGHLVWPMRVGRVPFDRLSDRSAWEFYAGDGRWTKQASDAVPVMDGSPMLSVHWSAYLRCYVAIYSIQVKNQLAMRTAPRPEGPWSNALILADCIPPASDKIWTYSGLGHPELARENGRIEYVSYYRETGFFEGEIRLLEFTFAPASAEQPPQVVEK